MTANGERRTANGAVLPAIASALLTLTMTATAAGAYPLPASVDEANAALPARQRNVGRALAMNARFSRERWMPVTTFAFPRWGEASAAERNDPDARDIADTAQAVRAITVGLHVLTAREDPTDPESPLLYGPADWSLASGLSPSASLGTHQDLFGDILENYVFANPPYPYKDIGTDVGEESLDKNGGDYDFTLRELVTIIHAFRNEHVALPNSVIAAFLAQGQFPALCTAEDAGVVPFTGQNPSDYLAVGPFDWDEPGIPARRTWVEFLFTLTPGWCSGDEIFGPCGDVLYPRMDVKVSLPETENHVLAIYTWRYLVQNYLEWVATLPADHPRYDACLKAVFDAEPARYQNGPELTAFMLEMLARFVRQGAFETNGRPYAAETLYSLISLASYADVLISDDNRKRVAEAARAALDYLATEYAFQSFEGKHLAPHRRSQEQKQSVSLLPPGALIFDALSGVQPFNDDIDGGSFDASLAAVVAATTGAERRDANPCATRTRERNLDCPGSLAHPWPNPCADRPYHWTQTDWQERAFWALLGTYRIPRAIHGFVLDKSPVCGTGRGGYFTRTQTRYSSASYPFHFNARIGYNEHPYAESPSPARPRYEAGGEAGEYFRPVTQYHFVTPHFANVAGGATHPFIDTLVDFNLFGVRVVRGHFDKVGVDLLKEKAVELDAIPKPYALIPAGDPPVGPFGARLSTFARYKNHYYADADPEACASEVEVPDNWEARLLAGTTALMPAPGDEPTQPFLAKHPDRIATYKNVSYGMGSTLTGDPMAIPPSWEPFKVHEAVVNLLGPVLVRVFDFTGSGAPVFAGHYVVTLGVHDDTRHEGEWTTTTHGLWEVVPGCGLRRSCPPRFASASALFDHVVAANAYFYQEDRDYTYTMATTGERLSLSEEYGLEDRRTGIGRINAPDGTSIPLAAYHHDHAALRELPLLEAWGVGEEFQFDGSRPAYADGEGRLVVENACLGERLELDLTAPQQPLRRSGAVLPRSWRFDELSWTSPNAELAPDQGLTTDGGGSMRVSGGSEWREVVSPPFYGSEIARSSSRLAVDVFIPPSPPNPYYLGAAQLLYENPGANLGTQWVGQVLYQGLVPGQWHTLEFEVPPAILAVLLAAPTAGYLHLNLLGPLAAGEGFRVDNLRFVGTLNDNLAYSPEVVPLLAEWVASFDDPSDWTAAAPLTSRAEVGTEGAAALGVMAAGYTLVKSVEFTTRDLVGRGPGVTVDVLVPSPLPNPDWAGDVQLFLTCPKANVHNAYLGWQPLAAALADEFQTLRYAVPASAAGVLGSEALCTVALAVNVPPGAGEVLLDALTWGVP